MRSDDGESGGEVGQCRRKGRACVSDGEGDELHSPPVLPEGLDEGKVLVGLVFSFVIASQVPAESDLDDDEDAVFLVEGVRVRGWGVWYSSGVDEVRCRAVAGGV